MSFYKKEISLKQSIVGKPNVAFGNVVMIRFTNNRDQMSPNIILQDGDSQKSSTVGGPRSP